MAKSDKKDKTTTEDKVEDVEMAEIEVVSVCNPSPAGPWRNSDSEPQVAQKIQER